MQRAQFLLPKRIAKATTALDDAKKQVRAAADQAATHRCTREKAELALAELPSLPTLDAELAALRERQITLERACTDLRVRRDAGLYADAHARGQAYRLDGELTVTTADADRRLNAGRAAGGPTASGASTSSDSSGRPSRRPYVRVRQLLAEQFAERQGAIGGGGIDVTEDAA